MHPRTMRPTRKNTKEDAVVSNIVVEQHAEEDQTKMANLEELDSALETLNALSADIIWAGTRTIDRTGRCSRRTARKSEEGAKNRAAGEIISKLGIHLAFGYLGLESAHKYNWLQAHVPDK